MSLFGVFWQGDTYPDLYFQRHQYKKRQRLKYSRWKEINKTWKLNAAHNPGLDLIMKKNYTIKCIIKTTLTNWTIRLDWIIA